MSLFVDVIGQYIDGHGKCRMVTYESGVSIFVSPIPPLSVGVVSGTPPEKTLVDTLKFIKKKELKITGQDGNKSDGIKGLWLETKEQNSSIFYAYIPIQLSKKTISNVPFVNKQNPLRVELSSETSGNELRSETNESELRVFRKDRKMADILKRYVLYTYALHPDEFDVSWLWVDPNWVYDVDRLGKKLVDGNPVVYSEGFLVVPSEEAKTKLMSYLKVKLAVDRPGVLNLKNGGDIMENYYRSVSDFKPSAGQLIFTNKNSLLRWKDSKHSAGRTVDPSDYNKVSPVPKPNNIEPYYYRNRRIRGTLLLIQNVEYGTIDEAKMVGWIWNKERRNIGYSPRVGSTGDTTIDNPKVLRVPGSDEISYVLYTDMGEEERVNGSTGYVYIYRYDSNNGRGNGKYAAILFFN